MTFTRQKNTPVELSNSLLRLLSFLLRISGFYRAETTALVGELGLLGDARLRNVRTGKPNVAKEIQSHDNRSCNSICDNNLPWSIFLIRSVDDE